MTRDSKYLHKLTIVKVKMQRIVLYGPQSCRGIFVLEALHSQWMSLHRCHESQDTPHNIY